MEYIFAGILSGILQGFEELRNIGITLSAIVNNNSNPWIMHIPESLHTHWKVQILYLNIQHELQWDMLTMDNLENGKVRENTDTVHLSGSRECKRLAHPQEFNFLVLLCGKGITSYVSSFVQISASFCVFPFPSWNATKWRFKIKIIMYNICEIL